RGVGALELGRRPAQVLIGLAARGQIAGDLRVADEDPVVVAQGGDDDVRPEARAVLAQAPALFLEAALARRDLELVRGVVLSARVGRVEDREVPADDLGLAVALDEL